MVLTVASEFHLHPHDVEDLSVDELVELFEYLVFRSEVETERLKQQK